MDKVAGGGPPLHVFGRPLALLVPITTRREREGIHISIRRVFGRGESGQANTHTFRRLTFVLLVFPAGQRVGG